MSISGDQPEIRGIEAIKTVHNQARAEVRMIHGIEPLPGLEWNEEDLAQSAREWANKLAADPLHTIDAIPPNTHDPNTPFGENVAWGPAEGSLPDVLAGLVQLWWAEKENFLTPDPPEGHADGPLIHCMFRGWEQGDPCSRTGNWSNIGHYT